MSASAEAFWLRPASSAADSAPIALSDAASAVVWPGPEDGQLIVQLVATRPTADVAADPAQVGSHLLESMLQGEAVDSLPIKTIGELTKAARDSDK